MTLKNHVKNALHRLGYHVDRIRPGEFRFNPYEDMARLAGSGKDVVVMDVGANRGQSVLAFRRNFPSSVIHAFEPSPTTFAHLKEATINLENVHLNNSGLGAGSEHRILMEGSQDTVSSLLAPGRDFQWSPASRSVEVSMESLDFYCETKGIASITVLKSDTQGFDLEVLKGAIGMLTQHRVQMIFVELNFLAFYEGMPAFEDVYIFLKKLGFELVSFYNMAWTKSRLGWLDALFIDPNWSGS